MKFRWTILLLLMTQALLSQDLHFSQFYNNPTETNPANVGFIPDADFRMGASYRNQWSAIMALPYRTFTAHADFQILREKFINGWAGAGLLLFSDVAGAGSLRSDKLYLGLAYHQMLGYSSLISAGCNIGWVRKSIDISSLKFPDQFDGKFFDASLPTSVSFATTNVHYVDMQAGLKYAYFPNEKSYFNIGYSLLHFNRPTEGFFKSASTQNIVPLRHAVFLNASLKSGNHLIIDPACYFTTQAKAVEWSTGLNVNRNLSEMNDRQLLLSLFYRNNDAIIPGIGFQANGLKCSFTYDVTVSSLRYFNYSNGAAECSIIKNGFYRTSAGRQSLCPKF